MHNNKIYGNNKSNYRGNYQQILKKLTKIEHFEQAQKMIPNMIKRLTTQSIVSKAFR